MLRATCLRLADIRNSNPRILGRGRTRVSAGIEWIRDLDARQVPERLRRRIGNPQSDDAGRTPRRRPHAQRGPSKSRCFRLRRDGPTGTSPNGNGYAEFNFWQNDNGTWKFYGGQSKYGVDVDQCRRAVVHQASTPRRRSLSRPPRSRRTCRTRRRLGNSKDFPGLTEPRDASFNTQNRNAPSWLRHPPLSTKQIAAVNQNYRKRAQSVEAVDKLLADTEATLAAEHLTDKTYIVFSSDNGYHLGQHRLLYGKQTAFDTDIRVPLIVAGPGVPAGKVMHQVVENTDLATRRSPNSVVQRSHLP